MLSNNSTSNLGNNNNNEAAVTNTNSKTNNNNKESKGYDNKINSYFKQSSTVKDNKNSTNNKNKEEQNNNINESFKNNQNKDVVNKETYMQEIAKLKQELEEVKRRKAEKDIELNKLKFNYSNLEITNSNLRNDLESANEAKDRATDSLVTSLRDLEEMKRTKQKEWVNLQSFKIGKYRTQSHGMNINQIWEDGVEIKEARQELEDILKEKEEEKRLKKKIGSGNYDKLEVYKFKMEMLSKSEQEVKEKLIKLIKDRITFEAEEKRLNEENKCNYSKKNWPILKNRYLILSLIGKGGYSEVYKAYDLYYHILVACKIHQLDQNWSENVKELYIRHTLRENKIHQNINHEKVVKHYDTVEIDNNSFATVLELCSGPDLSYYLKLNGHLSEREAKIIIKQIIVGLKELHSMKIIHYDLKPQNIIFNRGEIKISDFGLAKEMSDREKIELTCLGVGTYYYLPPETFDPSRTTLIDQKVDIWSVGVIFYELLYGMKPFGNNMSQEKILKDNLIWNVKPLEFPVDTKINVSQDTKVSGLIIIFINIFLFIKDFIKRCCSKDVNYRFTAQEAYDCLNEMKK